MSITLPPSSTTTIGLPSAATSLMSLFWMPWYCGSVCLASSAEARAIAGARVLLALVLRR